MSLTARYHIALCILVALCRGDLSAQSDSTLAWPSPPDPARITHVQTIASNADFKEEGGWWNAIVKFVAGGESDRPWLVQPVGIAVTADGRILIADPGGHCVHAIQPEKKRYEIVRETKFGPLRSPVGVAVDRDGRIFVADAERGTVLRLDDDLDAEKEFTGLCVRPTGLAVRGDALYIVDTGLHKVVRTDLEGRKTGEFGAHGFDAGEFNYPVSVAAGESVYVVDALNYRVQKFDSAGRPGRVIGSQGNVAGRFASPKAVALDSDGDVYVTDALMDNLQIFSPSGALLLVVGRKGSRDGEFLSPGGIAIDKNDRIYVVETLNKRIQIFQYHR
jgi:DNA-binding beta-propeller fold protein YncE